MMDKNQIEKLAVLARIKVPEEEIPKLQKDIENILEYVGELSAAPTLGAAAEKPFLRNIMREDENPHETGLYTENILENSPRHEKGYLVVKKIL